MPCLLPHVRHLVTVEELRDAADLIIHHAASVVPGASQRTQEEVPLFGETSQLRENTTADMQQSEGDRNCYTLCLQLIFSTRYFLTNSKLY